jgi:hypothetical protein
MFLIKVDRFEVHPVEKFETPEAVGSFDQKGHPAVTFPDSRHEGALRFRPIAIAFEKFGTLGLRFGSDDGTDGRTFKGIGPLPGILAKSQLEQYPEGGEEGDGGEQTRHRPRCPF